MILETETAMQRQLAGFGQLFLLFKLKLSVFLVPALFGCFYYLCIAFKGSFISNLD